ncbi:MAG: DUF3800 domain-containing protein [Hydrotalea sp.]|nr:DUF3800 domain-containing protein [Hydrotalea sp.]
MSNYTLYIDESGVPYSNKADDINNFFCLNGIIIDDNNYQTVCKQWEAIRDIFSTESHRPAMHLEDIKARKAPFNKLKDKNIRNSFNNLYLGFLNTAPIIIISVVLDKKKHLGTYHTPSDIYHFSFWSLLDRYCNFLEGEASLGKVFIETRDNNSNKELKNAFKEYIYTTKLSLPPKIIQKHIDKNLSIYKKRDLIVGIEVADMTARVMKYHALDRNNKVKFNNNGYDYKILQNILPKIRTDPYGKNTTKGYGIVFLP